MSLPWFCHGASLLILPSHWQLSSPPRQLSFERTESTLQFVVFSHTEIKHCRSK